MPRPAIDLEPYKETIIGLYEGGVSLEAISHYISVEFSVPNINPRTVRRRLQHEWIGDFTPHRAKTIDTPQLRARIRQLFNGEDDSRRAGAGLSDEQIIERLEEEGFEVGLCALVKIRKEEGLIRRGKGDQALWEDLKVLGEAGRQLQEAALQ